MPIDACRTARRNTHSQQCAVWRGQFRLRPIAEVISIAACGLALSGVFPRFALAQASSTQQAQAARLSLNIPSGALAPALRSLASTANLLLTFTEEQTAGKSTAGIDGQYTPQAALAALLAGTGLQALPLDNGGYVLRPAPVATRDETSSGASTLAPVTVTAQSERADGLPAPYAGGQVARGGRLGLLGNVDVMEAPFNITSYTAQLIEDRQAGTLPDVLESDSSVRRQSPSSGQYEYFWVRGFPMQGNDVAFNGLYGLMNAWGSIPTEFAERVEVLKGPSALLGGISPTGAVGGTINVVSKRAADAPLTRLTLGLESDSYWRTHLDLGRRFGERGEWGLRVNGSYGKGDTYVDGQSSENYTGTIALDYRGERARLALDAWRYERKQRGGTALFPGLASALTVVPEAPDGSTRFFSAGYDNNRTQGAMLSGEFDLNDAWTAYAKIGRMTFDRSDVYGRALNLQANGNVTVAMDSYPNNYSATSGEVGLRGQFRTGAVKHALALSASYLTSEGGYAWSTATTNPSSNIYTPTPITIWPPDPGEVRKSSEGKRSSVAVADTLRFADDRVLLTLGVRRQQVRSDSFNITTGAVTASYDKSVWTPMAGLVVKPRENVSLYTNYIQGLSSGTIVGSTYTNAGEVFPPYKTEQVEVGAKLETGAFTNTLSVFQITKPSTLSDYSVSATRPTLRLNGEQRNRGIEWSIFGELTRGVRMLGGVTYIQGRLTKTQNGTNDGNEAPGAAPWSVNLGAEWDIAGVPGLTVDGRLMYTSSQYVNATNTQKIPGWTRVDVGARYATRFGDRPVVLRAAIRNLFDRNYWEGSNGSGYIILAAPRTFHLSATVDF